MSSSPTQPPLKRRRTDLAASTLSKPFKSPLKTTAPNSNALKPASGNSTTAASTLLKPTSEPVGTDSPPRKKAPSPSLPPVSLPPTSSKIPKSISSPSVSFPTNAQPQPSKTTPSATLSSLKSHHSALLRHLTTLRSQLETSTQALNLEKRASHPIPIPKPTASNASHTTPAPSTNAPDLDGLTTKWRLTARAAAEEVFAKVLERVNRMGGMEGLREMEERREERAKERWREDVEIERQRKEDEREAWREERGEAEGGEWVDEDEGEGIDCVGEGEGGDGAGMLEEEGRGRYKKKGKGTGGGSGEEEEGYTMGCMLRDLGIELGVVGWDGEAGRWVD